jgi:ubiquinone/menaquinone biosynthesis C-methylase UbiE
MNRHNAKMNAFALRLLEPGASDRVLEIGFGGGLNLPWLIETAGFVAGIDRSSSMVQQARTRFPEAISAGNAVFQEGNVEALPFDPASFGKVCTVNTIYFWSSLDAGFAEIYRVLAPGGRAIVGFLPKEWMDRGGFPTDIFTSRATDDVIASVKKAGFRDARAERPETTTRWVVVVANK